MRRIHTLVAVALLAAACGGAAAAESTAATTGPTATPGPAETADPTTSSPDVGHAGTPVVRLLVPEEGLEELVSADVEEVIETGDESVLLVTFQAGVEECFGLARVGVRETETEVALEVVVGRRPPADRVCVATVRRYAAEAVLEAPLGDRTVRDISAPIESGGGG